MTPRRIAALVGIAVSVVCAGVSCSSFDADAPPETTEAGSESGGSDAASDSSSVDSSVADGSAGDAEATVPSPCPDGGGVVLFSSSFDGGSGPTLAGWGPPRGEGDASMEAVMTDGGDVARGSVFDGNDASVVYAVMERGKPLPPHFAVRLSFTFSAIANHEGYVIHQALSPGGTVNLALSLQGAGWILGAAGQSIVLGGGGADGARHTLTYRLESAPDGGDGGGLGEATFDQGSALPLDLTGNGAFYDEVQIGPNWLAPNGSAPPPPLVVDYDDVTVWDCSK